MTLLFGKGGGGGSSTGGGVDGSDGVDGRDGTDGTNGRDGRDGIEGNDGRGITSLTIAETGEAATRVGIAGINHEYTTVYDDGTPPVVESFFVPSGFTGPAGRDGRDGTDGAGGTVVLFGTTENAAGAPISQLPPENFVTLSQTLETFRILQIVGKSGTQVRSGDLAVFGTVAATATVLPLSAGVSSVRIAGTSVVTAYNPTTRVLTTNMDIIKVLGIA